jgi:hypothetical protein
MCTGSGGGSNGGKIGGVGGRNVEVLLSREQRCKITMQPVLHLEIIERKENGDNRCAEYSAI